MDTQTPYDRTRARLGFSHPRSASKTAEYLARLAVARRGCLWSAMTVADQATERDAAMAILDVVVDEVAPADRPDVFARIAVNARQQLDGTLGTLAQHEERAAESGLVLVAAAAARPVRHTGELDPGGPALVVPPTRRPTL
jgi:hypothetical protein